MKKKNLLKRKDLGLKGLQASLCKIVFFSTGPDMCENHMNGKMRSIAQILKINRKKTVTMIIWKIGDMIL